MTTDSFFGGVSNRLQNLRAMLDYVRSAHPTREQLITWVSSSTKANSRDNIRRHLGFLDTIGLIDLSEQQCSLSKYGREWLQTRDPETFYEALSSGVKGFDTLLDALSQEPMTDQDMMELLVSEFAEAEMSTPGPAIRHREWLQVLGFVKRHDELSVLTPRGKTLVRSREIGLEGLSSEKCSPDSPSTKGNQRSQDEETALDLPVANPPQLTDEANGYTQTRRRTRSSQFSRRVKRLYEQTCAFCGVRRETPDGNWEVEAAHIHPKKEAGTDDVRNGIALCKLHHWAFDAGWFSISDDYEILVKDASDREGYDEFHHLAGTTIKLPENDDAIPHPIFLEKHRARNGF